MTGGIGIWDYLQKSKKEFDMWRIDAQIKAYIQANAAQGSRQIKLKDDAEEVDPEDLVQVQLDSGEIIQVRAGDLHVWEPESEDEGPNTME